MVRWANMHWQGNISREKLIDIPECVFLVQVVKRNTYKGGASTIQKVGYHA